MLSCIFSITFKMHCSCLLLLGVIIGSQCALLISAETEEKTRYQLLSVVPITDEEVRTLQDVKATVKHADFWAEPRKGGTTPVLIPETSIPEFKLRLKSAGIPLNYISDDVERDLRKNAENNRQNDQFLREKRATSGMILNHDKFHKLKEVYSLLGQLKSKYPNNVEIGDLDHLTYMKKRTKYIHLFNKDTKGTKPIIFLDAAMHAREWLAPATALYIMDKLLAQHATGQQPGKMMLDNFEWLLIPVANPDGYYYTHIHPYNPRYRYLRTNRNTSDSDCQGVDLNRNFDVHFKKNPMGSFWKCPDQELYQGPYPFSEAETQNFRDLFNKYKNNIVAYVALHAYGQFLLKPWGWSRLRNPKNVKELDRVGKLMIDAIRNTSGRQYTFGTASQTVGYTGTGSSMDWVLTQKDSIYSYNFELRPPYSYVDMDAFDPKPTEIKSTGEEIFNSLKTLLQNIRV